MVQPRFLQGETKVFEQHIPGAVAKPSGSSHNKNIETFSPQEMRGVCGFFPSGSSHKRDIEAFSPQEMRGVCGF